MIVNKPKNAATLPWILWCCLKGHIMWLTAGFLMTFITTISSQSIKTEFGKSRVQYHDDFNKWWEYETENFIVYWYGKGRNIAQAAVQTAEYSHSEIQDIVEHRINDKIEIIVYTDLSDLIQSNIGIEETFESRHEITKVIGSRIFVFYDGSHLNLQRRIKEGIAHVYFYSMYSKKGLQEIVDSDPELDIPDWFIEGFVSYAGNNWDYLMEDEFRDLWYQNPRRYRNFDKLSREYPRVAGHTLWHYLDIHYGRTSITTLLYLMRLRSDFNENIEFVFGFDFKRLKRDWTRFYNDLYKQEVGVFEDFSQLMELDLGFKRYFPKSILSISPNGENLIYAVNHQGKYQVVLYHLSSGQKKTFFRYGSKNAVQQTDYNYPLVAWHPQGREITLCYENRDVITLRRIDLETFQYAEQEIPESFQRIYSIDYLNDEDYLFAANTDGFSDLYYYRSRYRQTDKITEDFYDDLDASIAQLGEQRGILFSSNRPNGTLGRMRLDTILPLGEFDIYFLPLEGDRALKLTQTPEESERHPRLAQGNYLTYLNRRTGMNNRWVIDLNSRRRQYINSNYPRNIILHDAVPGSGRYVFQSYDDGAYKTFLANPNWNQSSNVYYTSSASEKSLVEDLSQQPPQIVTPIDPGLLFLSKFKDPPIVEPLETNVKFRSVNQTYKSIERELGDRRVIEFISARAVASRRQFKLENIITRVDNEVLFEGLETYTADDQELEAQETGLLVKGIVKDIFEDFEIELGMRFPFNLKGSEFFATLDDNRKRLDKRYALYRKQKSDNVLFNNELQKQRQTTFIALYRLSYPFDTYRSVRATTQLRIDNRFLLNADPATSEVDPLHEQRASIKFEYIFDNTLAIDMNLRHGTRYKAYVELINRFDLSTDAGINFDISKGQTTVVGFDARHYLPVLRHSVIALRAAGASSFGSDKILYYVGGTDGWVIPKFNQDIPIPPGENFAFKTLAPNLRGFNHNARNGRSFALASAELRIPVFKYLSGRELRSRFLRNIQLVGFGDFGSAWHGFLPSKENNPLNTVIIDDTPGVRVTLQLDRTTFIYSYGVGARINFLGYFIRGDYAWGVESGLVGNPKFHLSLGTDF